MGNSVDVQQQVDVDNAGEELLAVTEAAIKLATSHSQGFWVGQTTVRTIFYDFVIKCNAFKLNKYLSKFLEKLYMSKLKIVTLFIFQIPKTIKIVNFDILKFDNFVMKVLIVHNLQTFIVLGGCLVGVLLGGVLWIIKSVLDNRAATKIYSSPHGTPPLARFAASPRMAGNHCNIVIGK